MVDSLGVSLGCYMIVKILKNKNLEHIGSGSMLSDYCFCNLNFKNYNVEKGISAIRINYGNTCEN